MGGDPLLLSFIVVIIGGLGSLRGTVIAALLIGLSDGIISVFFSPTLAEDPRHPPRRPGPRLPPAGPLRTAARREAPREGPGRCTSPSSRALAARAASCCRPTTRPTSPASWCSRSSPWATTSPSATPACSRLGHALFFAAGLYATGLLVAQRRPPRRPRAPRRRRRRRAHAAARRPARAPHHRHRLHDRDADVRPGRLPRHPLLRRLTRGDEGFTLARAARALGPLDLSADGPRYAARLRPLRRRPPRQPRARPLPHRPRPRRRARERRAHPHARLRPLPLPPPRPHPLRPLRRRRRRRLRPPLRLRRRHLRLRSSTRSCRCSGCCSAAPAPCSGRSSAPR